MHKFKTNGKWGVYDDEGWRIIAPVYDYISFSGKWIIAWDQAVFDRNSRLKRPIDGFTTVYNKNGSIFELLSKETTLNIISISRLDKDLYRVESLNEGIVRVGVINSDGEIIIPFEYEALFAFDAVPLAVPADREAFFDVMLSQHCFIVGTDLQFKEQYIDGRYIKKRVSGSFGVIDRMGNIIIPISYDSIVSTSSLLIDEERDYYVDPQRYYNTYAIVKKGMLYGVFDRHGHVVLPTMYSYISVDMPWVMFYLGGEHFITEDSEGVRNGLWGILNLKSGNKTEALYSAMAPNNRYESLDNDFYVKAVVLDGTAGYLRKCDLQFVPDSNCPTPSELMMSNIFWKKCYDSPSYGGWTKDAIESAYRGAYEGDSEAIWNND